ncbi:ornithine cyclodeaminase family protein, partial [Streptomyces sp. DT225]
SAVRAVRKALLTHHDGGSVRRPGYAPDLGNGDLVFTAGHLRTEKLFGFRVYDTLVGAEQLVAARDTDDGRLRAVVHSDESGPRRAGAIGAVAMDAAAHPGPLKLGLAGAGTQAWTQLWAIRSVRQVDEVTAASRRPERTEAFARRAAEEFGVAVRLP